MKRKQFGAKSDEKSTLGTFFTSSTAAVSLCTPRRPFMVKPNCRRQGLGAAAPMVRFLKCSRTGAKRRGGRDLTAATPEENLEFEGYFTQSAAARCAD